MARVFSPKYYQGEEQLENSYVQRVSAFGVTYSRGHIFRFFSIFQGTVLDGRNIITGIN